MGSRRGEEEVGGGGNTAGSGGEVMDFDLKSGSWAAGVEGDVGSKEGGFWYMMGSVQRNMR